MLQGLLPLGTTRIIAGSSPPGDRSITSATGGSRVLVSVSSGSRVDQVIDVAGECVGEVVLSGSITAVPPWSDGWLQRGIAVGAMRSPVFEQWSIWHLRSAWTCWSPRSPSPTLRQLPSLNEPALDSCAPGRRRNPTCTSIADRTREQGR